MGRRPTGSISRNLKGKGKAKPEQGNKKKKQRSVQNQKALAQVQHIIKDGKGSKKTSQDQSKNKNHHIKNQNNKGLKQRGGAGDMKYGKTHNNNKFAENSNIDFKGKHQKQKHSQKNSTPNLNNNKTKRINKKGGKKPFRRNGQDQQQDNEQQLQMPLKGNPLFQIVPEGMDDYGDEFAALGNVSDEDEEDLEQREQMEEQQQEEDGQQQYSGDLNGEMQEMEEDQQEGFEGQEDIQEFGVQDEVDGDQDADSDDQQQEDDDEQEEDEENQEANKELQRPQQEAEEQEMMEEQEQLGPDGQKKPVDISLISLKIQETIQILMNVQKLGQGKPRKHFIQELKQYIHQYYGYNFELISHFLDFFNPSEMVQFFESNETQRPLTIRTNTLKTRRKELAQNLIQRGVNLDPLAEWSKVGIKIYDTKVPIGATPQYLAGHYMLQSASSLLPVLALDPQVNEKILDMASAPGGKTTYIAQLMKNTGSIFANDLKKERLRALQFNLYRLGITNTAVICRDGRKIPQIFPATFDRVLLDAPCTGLGIISKDHSIKSNRVLIDIYKNSHLQKQLLLAAIDCCKVNGTVVYSTCSVSPLENEEVVNYALKRRFIKIVECGVEIGEEGLTKFVEKRFHIDLKKTRRIYPHVHNMDGFYVAKLIKVGKGKRNVEGEDANDKEQVKIMKEQENVEVEVQEEESGEAQDEELDLKQ